MQTKFLTITGTMAVLALSTVSAVQADQRTSAPRGLQVVSTSADYSRSMDELMSAAQKLRESIQSLAQKPPGEKRDVALQAAREALYDTQQAMVRLPADLRVSQSSKGGAANDTESVRRLTQASDRLYESLHTMAEQSNGARRNAAMKQAREALFETDQALVWLAGNGDASGARSGRGPHMSMRSDDASARGVTAAQAGAGSVGQRGSLAGTDAAAVDGGAEALAGGVGVNARANLSSEAAPDHNVKMVFSLTSGNYVADVNVSVADRSGRTVIEGTAHGPWLYAKLPPGTYTATASYLGHTVTEKFSVGTRGQRVAHFRWPVSVEQQAAAGAGTNPIFGTGPQEPSR